MGWGMIFGQRNGRQLFVRSGTTGGVKLELDEYRSGVGWVTLPGVGEIPTNQFTHVVATWDGTTANLYTNGLRNVQGALAGPFNGPSCPFFIGGVNYNGSCGPWDDGYFSGVIDEVSIYNRALSSTEIAAIYAAGSAGKCIGGGPTATSIVDTTLPVAGSTNSFALDRFSITATRSLLSSFATNSTNYSLREAGANGIFGDGDDVIYPLTTSFSSGATVSFTIANNPLQPGYYRFQTTTNLLDVNTNAVTAFTRDFYIANPQLGKIENTANDTLQQAMDLPLTESPSGSGFLTAEGVGSFFSTSDVNYWRITAQAGDLLTVRLEADATGTYPNLYLQNSADTTLTSVSGDSTGVAQFQNYQFSASGTYYLRVWSTYSPAHYRTRVDLARGLQMESESNDSQGYANVLATAPAVGGIQARVAGSLVSTDSSGDYFKLSTLNVGNTISASVSLPDCSSVGLTNLVLTVEQQGSSVALATNLTGNLNYTVATDAVYYVRIQCPTNRDLRAQYLLNVFVADTVPPVVTGLSVGNGYTSIAPADGSTNSLILDRFWLSFSEDMLAGTVNSLSNYDLRSAGPDGVFDTADDQAYAISAPGYSSGLSAGYVLGNGPLQPGRYRLTVGAGLEDRAGNGLVTPFVRQFVVQGVAGYVLEGRTNGMAHQATSLSLTPGNAATGFTSSGGNGVGSNPRYVAAGYFNSDSNLDLATANWSSASVSVLLGNGDGTFASGANVAVGGNPSALAAGDLNGDGKTDLVVANYGSSAVNVLLGDGAGGFVNTTNYAVGNSPYGVALADLNGDGRLDLVVANNGANNVSVLLGNGDGTFGARTNYGVGSSPYGLAVGDVTGDGKLDVVVANSGATTVSVLAGNGGGGLSLVTNLVVGGSPVSVAIGDVNGDGKPDLVTVNGNGTVSVLLGLGGGSFASATNYATGGSSPCQVVLADVNGDGYLDLVVANDGGSGSVGVLLGNGDGTFQPAVAYGNVGNAISVAVGDWNGDGRLDIAAAQWNGSSVNLLFGNRQELLAEDPVGSGLRSGFGRGSLRDRGDADYWSFSAQAGDLLTVALEVPGNLNGSPLHCWVGRSDGTSVAEFYSGQYGWGQSSPVALPVTGNYILYVNSAVYYWGYDYFGEYHLRVSLARPPLQMESEPNDQISQANTPVFTTNDVTRFASIAGNIRLSSDFDYFNLGTVASNSTIYLSTRLPDSSGLAPIVGVYNSQNFYQVESSGGRPRDGVAEVRIQQTGAYYARIEPDQGTGGLRDQYILDVQIMPTGLTNFPNLIVTEADPPAGSGIQSGQTVSFSYNVQNVGAIATGVGQWSDLAVISPNRILGDADDIPLGTNNGLFVHTGALNTNKGYTASQTVRLPDGISGDYYLIVKADALGQVNEGLLAGDNVTVSTNSFHIDLASYPDLQVENLAVTDPGTDKVVTVSWTIANHGSNTAPAGFYNQLLVRNQSTGIILRNTEYLVTQPIAVGATTSYVATITAIPPGSYQVAVTADSRNQVYEWAPCGHACAELNTTLTNFQVLQFYNVTVGVSPTNGGYASSGGRYQAGSAVSVSALAETNLMPFFFANWTEGGVPQSTNNPYTFTVSRDRQLVANFDLPAFQITASNNPPGAGTVSGTGSFTYGLTNILGAFAGVGYRFASWTENSVVVGTNATLFTVVYTNHSFAANYTEVNLSHTVVVSTSPLGLTNIVGSGIYSNGSSVTISAPILVSRDPNYYIFNQWTLNGFNFTNSPSLTKTFATTDPTNVSFVAQYNATSIRPLVLAANGNFAAPVPATTNFIVTIQFDRSMQTGVEPLLAFTNAAALIQANIPTGGVWLTTSLPNDTYRTPPINFVQGMDGANLLYASLATDLAGAQLSLTNCLNVLVDATPPAITNISAIPTPFSATITWTTDEPSTSQVEYGTTAVYGSSTTFASTLVTSHSQTLNGLLPNTTYHFHVLSRDAAGNLTSSPDRTFTTSLAPDLQVTSIGLLPQTNLLSGMLVTVFWTNVNTGLGPTIGSWLDQLVVSNLTTGLRIFSTNVYYDSSALGSIGGGDYRVRQVAVRLPDGLPGVGQLLFVVTADINNAVSEYNGSGSAETNNTATAMVTSTLALYPDLFVTGITIPPAAMPGASVQVSWTVTNQGGATATGPWTDVLYLSDDPVIGNDQFLANATYAANLAPGQSLSQTQIVVLPSGVMGSRFLVVNTDSGNLVFEVNKTNNLAISASAIQFLNPDLVVDSVVVPSSASFGDSIPVVWTVRNAGTGPAVGGWLDRISLSASPSQAGATPLLTLPITGVSPMAVGATYTRTQMVTLPLNSSATASNYFALVTTDSGNSLFELSEINNTTPSSSISLSLPQLPDLVVTDILPPTNAFAGQTVTLIWSITNQGAATAVGPWTDRILLAADASGNADSAIASVTYSNLLNPGDSLTRTGLVTLPPAAFGQMFFAVYVNSSTNMFEGTGQTNNLTVALSPTFIQPPDLAVTSIQAPLEVFTDRGFYVTWGITNQSAAPAVGSWVDRVYLSWDDQPGNDLLLGEFSFSGALLGYQSLTRIQSVSIPRNSVTNGYYHLVVTTDYANTLNEGTNNSNNTLVAPDLVHVTRIPLPDLVLESVNAPATAFSGQTITVRWTVQNAGTASTDTALWNDQVWLSTSTSPGGSWGNKFQNVSYLATNDAYIGSADLQIPITDFGTYYIVVLADCDNNVTEENKQNNITNAVIQVQLTPPPDLQVTSVQAPANSFSGQSIPVSWIVANLGPGPVLAASSTWVDTVLLSRTNVLDSSATTLYSLRHYGVLLTNQSYTVQNQAVTLPRNIFGDYYVFVATDAGNEVFEYGYENNNANYDHTPVHVTLTPPPDLVVEAAAPANAMAGQPLMISWFVLNQGAGDTVASLWYDSVYISANSSFDSSATLIGNFYHSGLLAAGGRYDASTTYTPSVCSSGPFYFYVVVDSYNYVQEFDPSYNAEGNNLARTGVPTSIAPVGAPDLQVPWVSGPQIGSAGSNIVVSWVVTNTGSASAPAGWIDRIYLSRMLDYNSGSPRSILDVQYPIALAVGASYTNTVSAPVPIDASGFYYVFVMADANNFVAECAGENNSLGSSLSITYINPAPPPPQPPPPPDLQVASVSAPATAISGQNIAVSWVVNNPGAGPAGGTWQDSVYLLPSRTTTAGEIFMGSFSHGGPLPAGSIYQASATITLPYRFSGAYYVMVWTDSGNNLGEASNQNNHSTISPTPILVAQAPLPDLQVTSVTAPTYALEGQNITVNWAVTNAGTGPTAAASWSDYVYLSRDQVLDPTDQFLGYATFNGVLSSGQSYSQSLSVQLPRGISGPYYIFVLSDARNAVLELSEDNNYAYASRPVQVDFQPLSDLTVTSVTVPASGSPGQPATFAWTVANQGGNAASAAILILGPAGSLREAGGRD